MSKLVKHASNAVVPQMLHIRCSVCTEPAGMFGTRQDFADLLIFRGWKLGMNPICPKCLVERVRKTLRKLEAQQ